MRMTSGRRIVNLDVWDKQSIPWRWMVARSFIITYRLFLFWKRKADYTMENGPWISMVNIQRSRTHDLQTNTSLYGTVLELGTHVSVTTIPNDSCLRLLLIVLAFDRSTIIRGFSPNPPRNAPTLKEVIIMKRILAALNMNGQPVVALNLLWVKLCPVRLKPKRPPSDPMAFNGFNKPKCKETMNTLLPTICLTNITG